MIPYNKNLKQHSRKLRNNMTEAEKKLWSNIRMKKLGCWFYRQKPVGDYIVDFYCPRSRLVIEVDGGQHFIDETIEYDRTRDGYLSSLGLKVLRSTNTDILTNINGVVERIKDEIIGEIPLIPPLPKGDT